MLEIDEKRGNIISLTNRKSVQEDKLRKASLISLDATTKARKELQETITVLIGEQEAEDNPN